MRSEELAKLNKVVLKYEVKDSTERSDFAAEQTILKHCRGEQRSPVCAEWRDIQKCDSPFGGVMP